MRRLRRFGFNRIKEGFDQLPTAVCFFDSGGGIVLCNRQMYRLSHYLFESDMQYLGEVEMALAFPPEGILRLSNMESTYRFPDNTIWQFEKTEVTDRYGENYTQLTAADVTELCHALEQLFIDNKKLAEDEENLRRLSENVEKIAREKELFAAKSEMHDNLAASIIVMKQFLFGEFDGIDAETVLQEWEKTIAFRETEHLPAKKKLFDSARSSGVRVRIKGKEPQGKAAELMYAAMQVCLNNAVQYARATELEVNVFENETSYTVMIYNNGRSPEKAIREGGGLTNLRYRIETAGGMMLVQSFPEFALVIEIPGLERREREE